MATRKLTDTDRLNWLEKHEGYGLISDDAGHWAVSGSGTQNVASGMRRKPIEIAATFFVEAKEWRKTIRGAIDAAIKEDEKA